MKSIVIFASGQGSNAQAIIDFFRNNNHVKITAIVCNNPKAGVIQIAARENIPLILIDRTDFKSPNFAGQLQQFNPSLIVLAGFLWKIPEYLIELFPQKIINLHPALLPKYGGKGMYGIHVHNAVKEAQEKESGITVHWVSENYDEGNIIMQARCTVTTEDNPEDIAQKIHLLEHFFLPRTIDFLLLHS